MRFEAGDSAAAVEAFDIALTAHAEYPDAVYHKAAVLSELGRTDEAVTLWKLYLEFDHDGPWAEAVIERLESVSNDEAESLEPVAFVTTDEQGSV